MTWLSDGAVMCGIQPADNSFPTAGTSQAWLKSEVDHIPERGLTITVITTSASSGRRSWACAPDDGWWSALLMRQAVSRTPVIATRCSEPLHLRNAVVEISSAEQDSIVARVRNQMAKSETDQLFDLGVGFMYEYSPADTMYSADYRALGGRLWRAMSVELFGVLCDKSKLEPKEWVTELVSGDIRNLILGIVTAITSQFNVSLGIAVPAAGLALSKGIQSFCSKRPNYECRQSADELLGKQRRSMEKLSSRLDGLVERDDK